MAILLMIILASFAITLCVWAAVLFLMFKKEILEKILMFLVSLSAGALMGGAFLHLLPEAAEELESELLFGVFLASFVFFFLLEKIIHWRHCHKADCEIHSFGYMNLAGDAVHNFIDGLTIASTFMVNPALGISTTLAVAIHEIPQEIGDFGVLVYSGFKKKTALLINYAVAMTVVIGGIAGYFFFSHLQSALPYLLPFAAGGFVYIAASDLMPEIRKEMNFKKSMISFSVFIAGILMMYLVKSIGE
ncbi:MAG: ZIP family metal transporter [Candidatus Nealsonbacteria bacterium DGGOD1a]|jgi:Predicted divalent heavy-metal cations transporter|nr:MAG: ZIP family metal transporter [Candidatus Nealsonbacteria bacterium DGGOD1a]